MTGYGALQQFPVQLWTAQRCVSSRREPGEALGRGIGAEKKLVIVSGSGMSFSGLNRMT